MAESQFKGGRVKINVGGTMFETSLSTLKKFENCMLFSMVADRWKGQDELFIDRNPTYFAYVLDYLRDGEYVVLPDDDNSLKCLQREAEFYNLPSLTKMCSAKLQHAANRNETAQGLPFPRPDGVATDANRGSEHERNRSEENSAVKVRARSSESRLEFVFEANSKGDIAFDESEPSTKNKRHLVEHKLFGQVITRLACSIVHGKKCARFESKA
ncbi:unnamed protein product [Cylicocyclus nassatus]|uniref:BTB domain-containing protein n=1 Tax=Cylicocyclus nassatus TaxID=53992 RepID=A0AA36GGV1_CYLNA|nr:unnamed protein product [Cylicocyclus nassatus]